MIPRAIPEAEANALGLAAAVELRQCHDETGIDLTDWHGPRALVEAYTGPLHPEDRHPGQPRTYVVGVPAVVTVYPDGRVLLEVDGGEVDSAILDDPELPPDHLEQALKDRDTVSDAYVARRIGVTITRPAPEKD